MHNIPLITMKNKVRVFGEKEKKRHEIVDEYYSLPLSVVAQYEGRLLARRAHASVPLLSRLI